ncbi:MAG: tetratricopeptide repeat protein [Chitinophagaceae bacterium]
MEGPAQQHFGTGDNVAGDKIINNILGKSVEYNGLLDRITELETDMKKIDDPEYLLKKSKLLNDARQDLQSFKQGIIRLAETFSKIEINTERLRMAREFFETGKLKEADALLAAETLKSDQVSLLEKRESLEKESEEIQQALLENSNEYLIKARVTAIRYELPDWFDQAILYFESAIKSLRSYVALYEYGSFLEAHNYPGGAKACYEELKEEYENMTEQELKENQADYALILNNLGRVCTDINEYEPGRACLLKALEIRELLEKDNEGQYTEVLATTLNNLGSLYTEFEQFQDAEEIYLRALDINETLEDEEGMAMNYNNLGLLYDTLNNINGMKHCYEKGLELAEKLALENPGQHEWLLALILNNTGGVYKDSGEFETALTMHKRALDIYDRLATANPYKYSEDIVKVLNNLGNLQVLMEEYGGAEASFMEALRMIKELAALEPTLHEPDLALVYGNLGTLHGAKKDYAKAVENYSDAVSVYERLAEKVPEVYEGDVADGLNNLGATFIELQQYEESAKILERAATIYRKLAENSPEAYTVNLAKVFANQGSLLLKMDKQAEGMDKLLQAYEIALDFPEVPLANELIAFVTRVADKYGHSFQKKEE